MELRHLYYFVAVAEELHFSRAAQRLHIAQPPLSQQIRNLEEELGVQLFERTKRRVELTDAGQVFLQQVRPTLRQIEEAVRSAQRASRGEIGRLVVGFNSSATYSVLPKILRVFRERCPEVELVLHELTTSQQLERFHHNQIDTGILYLPVEESSLNILSVLKEPLVIALPETHPLATQPQISILSLINEPFILPPHHLGAGLYSQIMSLFQQAGFTPKIAQEAILLQTAVSLVAGGVGIAIVPASVQNLQRTGVVYKSMQEQPPEVEIAVVWRRNDSSLVLQKFLHVVSEITNKSGNLGGIVL